MSCHSDGDGDGMELPTSVRRADVKAALVSLDISTADLAALSLTPRAITVVYWRRNAAGNLLSAGDHLATVSTVIGIVDD